MKLTPQSPATTGLESARLGIGPAAPPTPAALRFVTAGAIPSTTEFSFPDRRSGDAGSACEQGVATAGAELAEKMSALATRSKPSLFNPRGKIPEGAALALIEDFTRNITALNGTELNEDQQRDLAQLRKLARSYSEFARTRPDSLVQQHYPYMTDVLLDGCKAVLRSNPVEARAMGGDASLTNNVELARSAAQDLGLTRDGERVFEHLARVEKWNLSRRLPMVPGGSSETIGLAAHDLAGCFYAKQHAVATSVVEKALEYCADPKRGTDELAKTVRSAEDALTRTTSLSDNPLAIQYNEFRVALNDLRNFLNSGSVHHHPERPSVVTAIQRFAEFLRVEARFEAWAHPGVELSEKRPSGQDSVPRFDPSATWTREFRPNRALTKLPTLDSNKKSGAAFDSVLEGLSQRLERATEARSATLPKAEPFIVGIYNGKTSAELPRRFVDQTVVMQEEHRVPETERGPNVGIMTVAPAEEIARWAHDASVYSVQKGRELLGALYSFIGQDKQPELTHQLKEIISGSVHADLLRPGAPIICSELVLSKKAVDDSIGRVPENRYVLMNSLWRADVSSHYFDHETVLCLGICRKDPPNTAITAHQRFGWKILPDVEFRFNEKASYHVLYQELHPRDSLAARAQQQSSAKILPMQSTPEFGAPAMLDPADVLRDMQRFAGLPRAPLLKNPAIVLHANRIAAGVVGGLGLAVLAGGTPERFANPKEYLIKHCADHPIRGLGRRDIEDAKRELTPEARKELMESCFFPVGANSAMYVDKFYLLNVSPDEQAGVLQELRDAAAKRFPDRQIRTAALDNVKIPGAELLSAHILFEN